MKCWCSKVFKKYDKKLRVINSNDLEALLSKARKSPKAMSKVTREITQDIESEDSKSSNPVLSLYYLESNLKSSEYNLREYNIDDFCEVEKLFVDIEPMIVYESEDILPLPSTITLDTDCFLTPFPFIVEAPTLNPNLDYSNMFNRVIQDTGAITDSMHKV